VNTLGWALEDGLRDYIQTYVLVIV